jgi:MFS family permease
MDLTRSPAFIEYVANLRRIRREAWIVLAGAGVRGFTWGGISDTILSLYLLRMGYGPAFIGTAAAAANLGYALAAVPGSEVARRIGARAGLILGSLIWALCLVALSFADLLPGAWQQPWILTFWLLAASGRALDAVSGQPYLANSTTAEERPHAFALMISLAPLGSFLGSLLAGLMPGFLIRSGLLAVALDHPRPYGTALALGMLIYLPMIVVFMTLPKQRESPTEEATRPPAQRGRAPWGVFLAIGIVCALRVSGEFTARTFFSVHLDNTWAVTAARIGAAVAVANLLSIPAPMITPLLVQRLGRAGTISLGALGVAGSILLLGLSPTWQAAAGAFIAMTVLAAMARSVWSLVVQESVGTAWRSAAAGVSNLTTGLGVAAMSSVGGVMAATLGFRATFTTSATLVALGALAVWLAFRGHASEPAPAL